MIDNFIIKEDQRTLPAGDSICIATEYKGKTGGYASDIFLTAPKYCTYIDLLSKNKDKINSVIKKRNLPKERVLYVAAAQAREISTYFSAEMMAEGLQKRAAHAVSNLCFIGVSAGILDPVEILSDDGIIHETTHYFDFIDRDPSLFTRNEYPKLLMDKMKDLDKKVRPLIVIEGEL